MKSFRFVDKKFFSEFEIAAQELNPGIIIITSCKLLYDCIDFNKTGSNVKDKFKGQIYFIVQFLHVGHNFWIATKYNKS